MSPLNRLSECRSCDLTPSVSYPRSIFCHWRPESVQHDAGHDDRPFSDPAPQRTGLPNRPFQSVGRGPRRGTGMAPVFSPVTLNDKRNLRFQPLKFSGSSEVCSSSDLVNRAFRCRQNLRSLPRTTAFCYRSLRRNFRSLASTCSSARTTEPSSGSFAKSSSA